MKCDCWSVSSSLLTLLLSLFIASMSSSFVAFLSPSDCSFFFSNLLCFFLSLERNNTKYTQRSTCYAINAVVCVSMEVGKQQLTGAKLRLPIEACETLENVVLVGAWDMHCGTRITAEKPGVLLETWLLGQDRRRVKAIQHHNHIKSASNKGRV